MTQSKRNIIDKLKELYPYSEEWFRAQSEKKLYAMYYSYKPKANKALSSNPTTKIVGGDTYVLTDAGVYERMYD